MTVAGPNDAPQPTLIANLTQSMPRGFYRLVPHEPPRHRDLVIVRLPLRCANFAAERGYLPAGRPVLKRIAAIAGDRVCRSGPFVSINGRLAAFAHPRDRAGRPLPYWAGCHHLRADEFFVLGDKVGSFDSRYFGVVPYADLIGVARPLWTLRD